METISFDAFQWLSARLWYPQCISTGGTTGLHKAIIIFHNLENLMPWLPLLCKQGSLMAADYIISPGDAAVFNGVCILLHKSDVRPNTAIICWFPWFLSCFFVFPWAVISAARAAAESGHPGCRTIYTRACIKHALTLWGLGSGNHVLYKLINKIL